MGQIVERLNPRCGFFYDIDSVLVQVKSPWQDIELAESPEFGKVLLLDGITQVALKGEERYHETLVVPAMLAHPSPRRVLILGGGDGGVLREVLAFKTVEKAIMVDLDPAVIEFSRQYLPEINAGAFEDPRAEIAPGDGRRYVEQCRDASFDVVIMDMTDPFGPSEMLYTREFFQQVRRILDGDIGVFAMHGESPVARPLAWVCIHATLSQVFPLVRPAFAFVPMYGTLWSFQFASGVSDPGRLACRELETRLLEAGHPEPRFCRPSMWPALFAMDPAAEQALKLEHPIITDMASRFPDAFDPHSALTKQA
ncbi:MAG: polyamine aminopropyltransferase [Spirochaetaceae bacterium]|nr:polyamine aminopropyltransferase [Spirochaetaceae bacterium]